jgi:hypothetical protein
MWLWKHSQRTFQTNQVHGSHHVFHMIVVIVSPFRVNEMSVLCAYREDQVQLSAPTIGHVECAFFSDSFNVCAELVMEVWRYLDSGGLNRYVSRVQGVDIESYKRKR